VDVVRKAEMFGDKDGAFGFNCSHQEDDPKVEKRYGSK